MLHDLRYGLRLLGKSPAFTLVAVLSLALGIGANTAIFSVVDAVLLRPLAIAHPEHVVYLSEQWRNELPGFSVGNFVDIRRQSTSFENMGASASASFNIATSDTPERVEGEQVTASYWPTLGVQPMFGRVFSADEDQPGRGNVVVVSERLWRTHLRGDRGVIGQPMQINGEPMTVLGVMPSSFDPLLQRSDLWIPAAFAPQKLADHDNHYLEVVARLKPGISLAQANGELQVIARHQQQAYPIDNDARSFRARQLSSVLLGDQRLALITMLGAVGLVLLIACANIANLQLARARNRDKEIALRAALGASPFRMARQLLIENLVLGAAGAAAGILVAFWGVAWLAANGPRNVPRLDSAKLDAPALWFALAVAMLTGLLIGLAPALRATSMRLNDAFKQGIGTASGSRDRLRGALVVGEMALALMLLAGAGLLVRTALAVSHVDPGFDASNLIVGRIGLPDRGYADPAKARETFERIVNATEALPGVTSASVVSRAPLAGGNSSNGLIAEGRGLDLANLVDARLQVVSQHYLGTVHLPLLKGRNFTDQDTRQTALVTIINQRLAQVMWPGQDALGKRFACCEAGPKGRLDPVWHQVIGVVADVHAAGLDREVQPEFYLPMTQMPPASWDWIGRTMDLVVRSKANAVSAAELRSTVASIAPGVPLYRLSTMQQKIAGTLEQAHFDTLLLSIFAAMALLLAAIGVYGVLSYVVAQRTRDIGIRMALGASPTRIRQQVLGYGLRMALLGTGIGIVAGLAGARILSKLLFGVRSSDALTFIAVSLALISIAALASYLPARRATRIDPMVALRYE
ncbi:MAG: ABC transporter permease [Acidobacteria bacterium]|nr:ABC transporter permease [Acidobacteriota bacterium]